MQAVTLHYEYVEVDDWREEQLVFVQQPDGSWQCELSDEQMQQIILAANKNS